MRLSSFTCLHNCNLNKTPNVHSLFANFCVDVIHCFYRFNFCFVVFLSLSLCVQATWMSFCSVTGVSGTFIKLPRAICEPLIHWPFVCVIRFACFTASKRNLWLSWSVSQSQEMRIIVGAIPRHALSLCLLFLLPILRGFWGGKVALNWILGDFVTIRSVEDPQLSMQRWCHTTALCSKKSQSRVF